MIFYSGTRLDYTAFQLSLPIMVGYLWYLDGLNAIWFTSILSLLLFLIFVNSLICYVKIAEDVMTIKSSTLSRKRILQIKDLLAVDYVPLGFRSPRLLIFRDKSGVYTEISISFWKWKTTKQFLGLIRNSNHSISIDKRLMSLFTADTNSTSFFEIEDELNQHETVNIVYTFLFVVLVMFAFLYFTPPDKNNPSWVNKDYTSKEISDSIQNFVVNIIDKFHQ